MKLQPLHPKLRMHGQFSLIHSQYASNLVPLTFAQNIWSVARAAEAVFRTKVTLGAPISKPQGAAHGIVTQALGFAYRPLPSKNKPRTSLLRLIPKPLAYAA